MRKGSIAVMLAAGCLGAQAATALWQPVPGAPEMQVDTGSLEAQGSLVTAWVRLAGSSQVLRGAAFEPGGTLPPHHRRVVEAQVDCHRRTVRTLGSQALDTRGRPVYMATVRGRALPLPADEGLGWLYDALCELARARAQ